jgi:hypothetical protein
MKKIYLSLIVVAVLLAGGAALGWNGVFVSADSHGSGRIAGVWFVKFPEAPFPYHMMTFNADGTLQQANPDAGDPRTSDSDGMGIWMNDGSKIKGKFVEITADRTTHAFVARGEIAFEIKVGKDGNTLAGTAVANFYDESGKVVQGPINATMTGQRVTLP